MLELSNVRARIADDALSGSKAVVEHIPRADFIAELKKIFTTGGTRRVVAERLSTTEDGTAFVGGVELTGLGDRWIRQHYRVWIGYTFSHSNRRPSFLYGGLQERTTGDRFVVTRQRLDRRKAAGHIYIAVEDWYARWIKLVPMLRNAIDDLQKTWIDRDKRNALLITLARTKSVAFGKLSNLDATLDRSDGCTLYELLLQTGRLVATHPPISNCPISDQFKRWHIIWCKLTGQDNRSILE